MTDSFVSIEGTSAHVATIRLNRPPNNFFSFNMISALADALEELDKHDDCRCVVLAAEGKNFCAGADFSGNASPYSTSDLYNAATRLFRTNKPFVAAVKGAAIGGGLGLALSADFRIASAESKFSANFAQLGFHHGFGLTVTLPRLVGEQNTANLLLTGRRINGTEAHAMGVVDQLVPNDEIESAAFALASEIASSAPLAVESIRATLRKGIADQVAQATQHEMAEQTRLKATSDFVEGTKAVAERRPANFQKK
jgi:2-(1,2-epoxy-1,2-dihydrophenyl)acetyl-CoA isomerase